MLPFLSLDGVLVAHTTAAALAFITVVTVGIINPSLSLISPSIWLAYHSVAACLARSTPIPLKIGDGNTARQLATAVGLAALGTWDTLALDLCAGANNAASEAVVGTNESPIFSALALAAALYLATLQINHNAWAAVGRIAITLATAARNYKVRVFPSSGFTDAARPQRIIINEYVLILISSISVLGGSVLYADDNSKDAWIGVASVSAFLVLVTAFAIDKAYTRSPTTRAEQIANSLLEMHETMPH